MIATRMLMVATGLALLAGQASAQTAATQALPIASKSVASPSLQRAMPSKGRVNRQFTEEMSLEMIAFLTTGTILTGAVIYNANHKESGKSPK